MPSQGFPPQQMQQMQQNFAANQAAMAQPQGSAMPQQPQQQGQPKPAGATGNTASGSGSGLDSGGTPMLMPNGLDFSKYDFAQLQAMLGMK